MITFPSSGNRFTATFQGDYHSTLAAYGYTRSRSMLRLKREDVQELSRFGIYASRTGSTEPWVQYYTTPDGVLEIPLANLVNKVAAAGEDSFSLSINLADTIDGNTYIDTLAFTVYVLPGISYLDANAPREKQVGQWIAGYSHQYVVPPNVMLNPALLGGVSAPGLIVESNFHSSNKDLEWSQVAAGIATAITPTGVRENQLTVDAGFDRLRLTDGELSKDWPLAQADYCADLVCVRWTSLTGATRQHVFPVVAYLTGSDKELSLVTPGNGYEVVKDAWQGVRCRLTGLTAYGFWYYMDMLRASDLHAIIQPTASPWETQIASKETAAYIEPSNAETPSGNGFFNFEFTLKMRQYDTI